MSTASIRLRRRFHSLTRGRTRGVRTLLNAFLRLDFVEDMSYPLTFALSELGIFVPVLSYFFIAELVGNSAVVGDDYFTFAAIGIGISVMLNAALSGFGIVLSRSQNRGQLEYVLTEPIPWLFLPFAMASYRTILGVFNGLMILVLAVILGANVVSSGIPEFLVLVMLGLLASMAIGILAASVLIVAKRSQPLLTLYSLAASLLGGALFSVEQLPSGLQTIALLIPHTYVINSARAVLMEDPGTFVIPFDTAVIALSIFNVVTLTGGMWLFSRSLQYARREGLLGGY